MPCAARVAANVLLAWAPKLGKAGLHSRPAKSQLPRLYLCMHCADEAAVPAARVAANVLLARAPKLGKAGLPRAITLPKEEDSEDDAGKKGLLRRLLSSKSSVASLLKRSSSSAASLELCTAAGSDGASSPVR